jgi:sec-independent protein translocase protein TatC
MRGALITSQQLKEKRRFFIVAAFVAAAVLTPPDVVSQLALAVPLIAFYEISILIGRWIEKKREAEDKKAEEEENKADQASS